MSYKDIISSNEQIQASFLDGELLMNYKAIIECHEAIPCNPCEYHCPFDAIVIGENMNTPPKLIGEACVGCGICVSVCPGLAIMLAKVNDEHARFVIPYEFNPKPQVHEVWHGINRQGEVIGDVVIERVVNTKNQDHTSLITVKTDSNLLHDFITIKRKNYE